MGSFQGTAEKWKRFRDMDRVRKIRYRASENCMKPKKIGPSLGLNVERGNKINNCFTMIIEIIWQYGTTKLSDMCFD